MPARDYRFVALVPPQPLAFNERMWVMTRRKRRAPTLKCEKQTTSVPTHLNRSRQGRGDSYLMSRCDRFNSVAPNALGSLKAIVELDIGLVSALLSPSP